MKDRHFYWLVVVAYVFQVSALIAYLVYLLVRGG